jgi:glycosyltransferase involved in cell wall biosynthesis
MKSPERIIFVPFIHAFAGVERLIVALSRFLHDHDMAHAVACFSETIEFSSFADWPMKVRKVVSRRDPIAEGWALNRYLRDAHVGGSPPPLLFDLKGAFYAGMFPSPGYHLHLTDPPSLLSSEVSKHAFSLRRAYPSFRKEIRPGLAKTVRGEIVHRINSHGASRALSVIVMTDAIADELRAIYSVEAKVVRPGVRIPSSLPRSHERAVDHLRMLSVCRLETGKRLDWMLKALAGLESSDAPLSKKSDWTLNLVGDGSQREELQKMARQLGIAERVVFHGRISDAGVDELFDAANLFLMPAVQGYGLPALEALARGVPVILHRESGVSEILNGSRWAEIIEAGIEDLATAINTMVDRLRSDELVKSPVPAIPTEIDWAREICALCNWI